ncbi:MAG: hypothetical protein L6R38_006258 [Xanthoria sp. 2 TBL-2021]|nr:MAG: hypothetical protein L6R38_006258 [Xanthoria sp. 2 TBL-2021]
MFAVPGWSVSASQLKLQQESRRKEKTAKADDNGQSAMEEKKSKKRKRGHSGPNGTEVTNDNIADLWQKHIEGKSLPQKTEDENPPKEKKKRVRKQKVNDSVDAGKENHSREAQDKERVSKPVLPMTNDPENRTPAPTDTSAAPKNRKTKIKQRKAKGHEQSRPKDPETSPLLRPSTTDSISKPAATTPAASLPPAPPPLPSNAKLTPLQTAMRAKLISARFRHLNQTLYTTPSTHASALFSSNPEAFASYHAGFRTQVASWPSNPVEIFIEEIKTRGASGGPRSQKQLWRAEKKKKGGKKGKTNADTQKGVPEAPEESAGEFTKIDPLPRYFQTKICAIIDLGCGDAHLHASLLPLTDSLHIKLQSFDLAPGAGPNAPLITVSDIAKLPLADNTVDVAIFCLALMGTNWIDFVVEAARVVRVGGECWVGEVRSRFAGTKVIEKLKGEKGGKGSKEKKRKKKGGDDNEEEDELKKVGAPILVEEEEIVAASGKQAKLKEQVADVGPFLEVFRKRGFVLKGEVDMGNKMFVRMRFARVRDQGAGGSKRQDGTKFVEKDDGEEMDPEVEAKVLKPCVYKTR